MDDTAIGIGDDDDFDRDPYGLDPDGAADPGSTGDAFTAGPDGLAPTVRIVVARPSATEAEIEALVAAPCGDAVNEPIADAPAVTLRQLAVAAGCLDLAEDAVRAVNPGDSREIMAAHQLAASHALAMRLTGRAMALSAEPDKPRWQRFADDGPHDAPAARAAQSAARMMGAYRANLLMLDRLRHGNRLTITVERPDG